MLVFGATSAVFNSTVEANRAEIDGWFATLLAPFRGGGTFAGLVAFVRGLVDRPIVRGATVLGLIGLVYGFLSPDFGFNAKSALLFASLAIGLGAVTYINEGGAALFAERRLHVPAGVRVHAGALLVAIVCVAATRLFDLTPGLALGFVASTVLFSSRGLTRREEGLVSLVPAAALLIVSLGAWALLGALRASPSATGAPAVIAEAILAVLFVAGLEGVFYATLPLTFMDGRAVFDWNRAIWAVAFGIAAFLFWQLLINPDSGYLDAMRQTKVLFALAVVFGYVLITAVTWSYFALRHGGERGAEEHAEEPLEEPVEP